MDPKIQRMTATTSCVCGSGDEWKRCCGKYLKNPNGALAAFSITGKPTIRFFLADLPTNQVHEEDGVILVFTNRAQALQVNERLQHKYQICGMSAERWAMFQKAIPNHVVISDAVT
jgi:hypothetical protein